MKYRIEYTFLNIRNNTLNIRIKVSVKAMATISDNKLMMMKMN
jgi:hypothetical protein